MCVCLLASPRPQAKKEHGANAASLAASLQRLFTYGWQPRGGGSGSSTPRRGTSSGSAAALSAPAAAPAVAAAVRGHAAPASPAKYRPPHARSSTQEPGSLDGDSAAHLHLESSDSESSDAEGGGGGSERYHASRVRSGALACLQLLVKADPKSLHGSWTALLPASDAVVGRRGIGGGHGGGGGGPAAASLAHLLLHDPQMRVRHAAAATVGTLLEGPAQRAYLAVAEARDLERPPLRCAADADSLALCLRSPLRDAACCMLGVARLFAPSCPDPSLRCVLPSCPCSKQGLHHAVGQPGPGRGGASRRPAAQHPAGGRPSSAGGRAARAGPAAAGRALPPPAPTAAATLRGRAARLPG